jgi:hypothetical protein
VSGHPTQLFRHRRRNDHRHAFVFVFQPRVAIYVPVCTPDEDEDQGTQMAELRRYALGQGWRVLEYRERHGRAGRGRCWVN